MDTDVIKYQVTRNKQQTAGGGKAKSDEKGGG
jgi:hypothetical protein